MRWIPTTWSASHPTAALCTRQTLPLGSANCTASRASMLGIEINELRKVPGVGRGAMFHQSLTELERAGSVERVGTRVRVIARME